MRKLLTVLFFYLSVYSGLRAQTVSRAGDSLPVTAPGGFIIRGTCKGYRIAEQQKDAPLEKPPVPRQTEVKTEGGVVYADAANSIARREPYVLGANDLDWRGTGKSFNDALVEAFRRTGVERSEFEVTRWGKDLNGKSIPVEYRAPGGAEVSVDFAHEKNGPDVQHVGWQTPGKGNQTGHILLDKVPAGRSANKLDRSQH